MDLVEHHAFLIEETTNQTKSQKIKSNAVFFSFFWVRGENQRTFSGQSREPTNSTDMTQHLVIAPGPCWWKAFRMGLPCNC